MRYMIMCGGDYKGWDTPRQLTEIDGETIVARTIRLLRECGIDDIVITSNNPAFDNLGVPVFHHKNEWEVYGYNDSKGMWVNGFFLTDYPVCYLFGDVIFSKFAIKTIVDKKTSDIEFFASAPPFDKKYPKEYAEPFGFKVVNTKRFKECIDLFIYYKLIGEFKRDPMSWELWQIIKGTPLNQIVYSNYTVINDYTCDIDNKEDINYYRRLKLD